MKSMAIKTKKNYTYADFERALGGSGYSFSDADMRLAQSNPDAGMSLLGYKRDYDRAASDEARYLANAGAENIRREYGGYTGGEDGSGYYLEPLSPSSFAPGAAPEYQSAYRDDIAALYDKQKNYGGFQTGAVKPIYTNRYEDRINSALDAVTNPGEFSYDAAGDELYAQYAKAYNREGQRAQQNALGQAAAASGGRVSSYAQTAAGQAGNHYAAALTDKIPELYDMAYNRYLNDYSMKQAALGALQGAEANDYAKYQNALSQYNTDRSFDYTKWLDGYNMLSNNLSTARQLEGDDYAKYQNALSQYNTDRAFDYGQLTDQISHQAARREEERQAAQTALDNRLTLAQLGGSVGDYSGYAGLGFDPSYAAGAAELEKQAAQAELDAYRAELDRAAWQQQMSEQEYTDSRADAEWERQYKLALLGADMGDTSLLSKYYGIVPGTQGSTAEAAGEDAVRESALYSQFMLGYFDEPGVREYIEQTTGMSPERYAELLNTYGDGESGYLYDIRYRQSPSAATRYAPQVGGTWAGSSGRQSGLSRMTPPYYGSVVTDTASGGGEEKEETEKKKWYETILRLLGESTITAPMLKPTSP